MRRRHFLRQCRIFLLDESGQASAEYTLMLSIGLMLGFSVVKKFIKPYLEKMSAQFSSQLSSSLFGKANMHTLRIGRH
jgi:Flp pilus assembly pilin Flp